MGSSAYDLLVVPIFSGTLGSIGAGAILLFVIQTVETLLQRWCSTPRSWKPPTRSAHAPLPRPHRPAPERGAISVHG